MININKALPIVRTLSILPALLLILVAAGCASPNPVTKVQFSLIPPDSEAMTPRTGVVPGSKFKLAKVTLTDQQGQSRSSEDGQEISVEVKGGTYDAATREVTFSADRSEVPADGYEVAVVHPDGARSVQRFKADFARVDGPDPRDVAAFAASLMWRKDGALYEIPEGMSLIPGEEYELHAQANDVHGRTFESTDGDYPLPGNRLDKTLTGFHPSDANENGLIAEDGFAAGEVYKVDVAYGGENGQRISLAFNYDPAISRGPSPEMVSGLDIVGELASDSLMSPGAVKTLEVRVTDTVGRSWNLGMEGRGSHSTNEFPLPGSRLGIQMEHADYGHATSEVRFSSDARGMLGKTYRVIVTYADDPRLVVEKTFSPDFLSIVPIMEEEELAYTGAGGNSGREGRDGQQGSRGNDSGRVLGRAGDGRAGGHGTSGQNGARGSPGPNLRIIAREVRTIDAKERLVLFEVRAPGMLPEYYIRSIDAAPVTVVTRGGTGGPGGVGGTGGDGGNGGDAYYSGDGGDGGNAGGGGDGGDGGNGGSINLILTTHELEKAFVLDSQGGAGGIGGDEGVAGQPGIPGSIDSWTAAGDNAKKLKDLPPPEVGAYGNEGNIGYTGRAGHDGLPGLVQLAVDETQASALVRRVPDELRTAILY